VHHARNDRYIDRNYAGVLVVWDRLLGSYVDEHPHDAPVYGIVEPLHTYNPLKATFHEWASMAVDFASVRGGRNKLRALFAPPAWATDYHARRVAGPAAPGAASSEDTNKQSHTSANHTAALQTQRRP
jgi:hypothetical protein